MKITLRLYATLRDYMPDSSGAPAVIELPEGATIPEALATRDVPLRLAHIVMVGGRHVLRQDIATRQLQDGDELAVFPAIGGG
jgi:sulfur carrier protein ThiS